MCLCSSVYLTFRIKSALQTIFYIKKKLLPSEYKKYRAGISVKTLPAFPRTVYNPSGLAAWHMHGIFICIRARKMTAAFSCSAAVISAVPAVLHQESFGHTCIFFVLSPHKLFSLRINIGIIGCKIFEGYEVFRLEFRITVSISPLY